MNLRDRIGVDIGRRLSMEDGLAWAAANGVRFVDFELDTGPNALTLFDAARAARLRELCERHAIHLGLHTLSAVNIAEYSPYLAEAADAYLRAYIDAAAALGAEWIVVHAGYHFTADKPARMAAGLERLRRACGYAEERGALLILENLNKEPAAAEVHYLAHTVEEWSYYYERIRSPAFALAFTANHAHLLPEGVAGFTDLIPIDRVREVRLADCHRLGDEIHLPPGEGDFDFADLFARMEGGGFTGHYMNAFGSLDDMQAARDVLARLAARATAP